MMHVLLVEDNAGDSLLIQEAFQDTGADFYLSLARDGEVALAMLHGASLNPPNSRPDLILLDLNMPKTTGHDLLREVKSSDLTRRIPIFVLTSSRRERDVSTALDLHCNAYFRKPVNYNGYVQLVRLITEFWQSSEWSHSFG